MQPKHRFWGDPARRPRPAHPKSPAEEPYVADKPLIRAVNVAMRLNRPLLLEGEAGCGKTRLAYAVAHELGRPLYRWDVRSTSKAGDGLYRYDAVLRLHDVQVRQAGLQADAGDRLRDPANPTDYCTFGALGQAFTEPDWPAVVLIDEIDKADLDFPNDLLAVLEEPWEFEIPETGQIDERKIRAAHPPFVIITSNKEKGNLPAPFLRRCVYYWLAFPDADRLRQIVARHYARQHTPAPSDDLRDAAIARFGAAREARLHKPPSASEFLDWLKALQHFGDAPFPVEQLRDPDAALPYPELLFKLRADWPRPAQPA